MAKLKDESIFQGIIEFTAPSGTRFRFEQQGNGIYSRFARPDDSGAFFFDGRVRLTGGGKVTPERLLAAADLA